MGGIVALIKIKAMLWTSSRVLSKQLRTSILETVNRPSGYYMCPRALCAWLTLR